jgi:4-carboxymuconolactone decarboxylase
MNASSAGQSAQRADRFTCTLRRPPARPFAALPFAAQRSDRQLCCDVSNGDTMNLDEKGLATRRAVLGDAYVDGALSRATPFTAPLQELVTRHAWGNTWQRPGIDLRTRSIVTVSMLVALGRMHELKIHVRGALNNGVTPEELQEIFLHASVYCGFPAAVDAFRNAAEVVEAVQQEAAAR